MTARLDTLGRRIPNTVYHPRNGPPHPGAWTAQAACRGYNPEIWFPPPLSRAAYAKSICETCPVIADCLAYALVYPQAGVWGGLTESQRHTIYHVRRLP